MDIPTQNHLTTLRGLLAYRLSELQADVSAAQADHMALSIEPTEVRNHQDDAMRGQAFEMNQAEEQRDLEEMGLVKAALQRLDAGTYGDCADCGEPIGLQRLMVQPAACRCAACQHAHEQVAPR